MIPDTGPPGLRVVSGAGVSDTVETALPAPLVLELRDSSGHPVNGAGIDIGSLLSAPSDAYVYFSTPSHPSLASYTYVLTDSNGRVAVSVRLGRQAGRAFIGIYVREGPADTVTFDVQPGAVARLRASPFDTSVFVGGTASYRAYVTDRLGNRRTDTVAAQYQTPSPAVTVSNGGAVLGAAIGRAFIVVTFGGLIDTQWVSVVPPGRIAAIAGSGEGFIYVLNLDGSAFDTIANTFDEKHWLHWSPVDSTIVLHRGSSSEAPHLFSVDVAGNWRQVITDSPLFGEARPSYARDGSFIYFLGIDAGTRCDAIWRVRPDGSELGVVATDGNACGQPFDAPSPSPDGTKLAFLKGDGIRIRTLATSADTMLGVYGGRPWWSPTGEWIAYDSLGYLNVVHPDGTGAHMLRRAGYPVVKPDWSPDGAWLLYRGVDELEIVNVQTGLVLPLAVTLGMNDPAWKP